MADAKRDHSAELTPADLDALTLAPFFRLADLLQKAYPEATPIGSTRAPAQEAVRFKAAVSLAFPASEVASIAPSAEVPDGLDVRVNLIGLYGPSSPLPTSYTERIIHAENSNALGDFLDLFNHRFTGLLYLVWKHYQHHLRYETGGVDSISQAVAALFGLPPLVGDAKPGNRRPMLLPYTGLLAMSSRSAPSISRVVAHYFGIDCEIEEFVPRWIEVPDNARFRLGADELELGVDTILGEAMEDIVGHFRIWCGPLSFSRYMELLPDRPQHRELNELIDFVVRDPLSRDIGFRIEAGTTPDWSLGEGELGWTTWAIPGRESTIEIVI
jgi:type VI secretion system protein ImpH